MSGGDRFTAAMADWIIKDLRHKATSFVETGMVSVYDGDVVKSDTAIPPQLRMDLEAAVAALEAVDEEDRDWHPGSGGKVLDLVHPSLFPLIYGRSHVLGDRLINLENCLQDCGGSEILETPERPLPIPTDDYHQKPVPDNLYSTKFQWLPCEVVFDSPHDSGDSSRCA